MSRWLVISLRITIILVIVFGGIYLSRERTLAAPEQPIPYDHQIHVSNGIQCLFCHSEATRAEIAGIPSVEKCMGCHLVVEPQDETVKIVAGYWDRQEPIPWERVNVQPDFVYFSHRAHILSSVSCETCHGDVGNMQAAKPVVKMDMGWCLKCHLKQPEEKTARLVDCIACHK